MRGVLTELYRRDRLLTVAGWSQLVVLGVILVVAPFDDRTVLGLNPWIKPGKFLVSIAVYLWTIAWILPYVGGVPRTTRVISVGVTVTMLVEIVCILGQSVRGVRSHFNDATPVDAMVFGLMGFGIAVNTALVALLGLLLFTRPVILPRAYLWAVRLGVLLFLFGSIEGGVMIARGAHAVGVVDGGAGLPLVNWSRDGGDLRIAHAVALHGLQALPLFAFGLRSAWPSLTQGRQLAAVGTFAVVYLALGTLTFMQATRGMPLVPS